MRQIAALPFYIVGWPVFFVGLVTLRIGVIISGTTLAELSLKFRQWLRSPDAPNEPKSALVGASEGAARNRVGAV